MPTQRLSMRRIKEVLRLKHFQGLPERAIARSVGVSNGVVHSYLSRARSAGLSWPLPEGITDEGLELLLFPGPTASVSEPAAAGPRLELHRCRARLRALEGLNLHHSPSKQTRRCTIACSLRTPSL
jgi:hypothetical protein